MGEEQLQSLLQRIEELERKIALYEEHQHLGIDGSKVFDGETVFHGKEMLLSGAGINRRGGVLTPLKIALGQDDVEKQKLVSMGIAQTAGGEQLLLGFTTGNLITDQGVNDIDATNPAIVDQTQAYLRHTAGGFSPSGPSILSSLSSFSVTRTPIRDGMGTIQQGGSVLTDSDASFIPNRLAGSIVVIQEAGNTDGTILESYMILSNTTTSMTLGTAHSRVIPAQFESPTGVYTYRIFTPGLLGTSMVPFSRAYIGEDIRLGYGDSDGDQVLYIKFGYGSPEGVVPANAGSLYLRTDNDDFTNPHLYTKVYDEMGGNKANGWRGIEHLI